MKNFLPKKSIFFNAILLFALTFLGYEAGFLNSVLAAGHPVKQTLKKKLNTALASKKNDKLAQQPVAQNPSPSPTPQITDTVTTADWWQDTVKSQLKSTKNNQYKACIFGDSISSGLGNTLGEDTYNFAIGGMSTVSLESQLKTLNSANVKCQEAIIAIGTNDAMYNINNEQFIDNLKANIDGVKALGATRVILIPAFYSTVAASRDPNMAGTIERVNEINDLIRQVVDSEKVAMASGGVQALYDGQALKENLTLDGVHLNDDGKKIYRQVLIQLL